MTKTYTDADVRLLLSVLPIDHNDHTTLVKVVPGGDPRMIWGPPAQLARAVLDALAAAGRLAPGVSEAAAPALVDPARVHAVLEVLGWPDDRTTAARDAYSPTRHLPKAAHWDLAEDAIRAADAAATGYEQLLTPKWHLVGFEANGCWRIIHPLGGCPDPSSCRVAELTAEFDEPPAPPGWYECEVNDLRDRLLIGDRVDAPEATDA